MAAYHWAIVDRRSQFHVAAEYQPLVRMLALDGQSVFDHPQVCCWRKLPDRENCTLDADLPDGRHVRLHIKRYSDAEAAQLEVHGHELLVRAGIPTAALVAWGEWGGRSVVIFDDLTGYTPADKLVERGVAFETLLEATANLAASLHKAELHHRDLYLCHFMARVGEGGCEIRLIDVARVRRLPGFLKRRWIVKDLAQFWYSTLKLSVSDDQRRRWLADYATAAGSDARSLLRPIERKARSIARHDARLHRDRPERDVSIPS